MKLTLETIDLVKIIDQLFDGLITVWLLDGL